MCLTYVLSNGSLYNHPPGRRLPTQRASAAVATTVQMASRDQNPAHAIPTRAEMEEMGFGEDEELTISLPIWSDDDDDDEPCRQPNALDEAQLQDQARETLALMLTVAPQHNHTDRRLHADPALLEPPPIDPAFRIASVDVSAVSAEEFHEEFVRPGRPAMLRGVPEHGGWRALERWSSPESMAEHYGATPFKVWEVPPAGGMGKGMPVELPLREYARYAASCTADAPFYVFQKHFGPAHDELRADYSVPAYFRDDLYDTTPKIRAQFPLYRYFVVGGPRTGSNMHTDPHFTAAWNALLCGRKRWA